MHKNALPPKTRAPPSDSSGEESGSRDEETEDAEQAVGGSGCESGSDGNISGSPSGLPSAVKAVAPASALGFPAKRTRQSLGKKDKDDMSQNKRKKPAVVTSAPRAAPKAVAQQGVKKRATKAERGKSLKPLTDEKKSATQRKNKTTGPKTVGTTSAKKKVTSQEVVVLDGDSSEESPVKATPPAVVAASAETSGAGTQGPLLKSVPTKGPAISAMDVDFGTNTSRVAVQNGAQGGHAVIPEVIEKSGRAGAVVNVSDEMRAENLAVLRDMSDTCVKMVQEAKVQSLFVSGKILEETRIKTTEIVEEARVKSCLIMEELRLVTERLGTFAGQSGVTWCNMYDNPFQGTGLLGGVKLPPGDPNDVKWQEQCEAEQGLIMQRLQLVQDQAQIQRKGLRLKLNIQKQQALAHAKRP